MDKARQKISSVTLLDSNAIILIKIYFKEQTNAPLHPVNCFPPKRFITTQFSKLREYAASSFCATCQPW